MKRVQLQNTGDVGTKFSFDAAAFAPHFSIFPSEGFVSPNQDVKLEITFHPTARGLGLTQSPTFHPNPSRFYVNVLSVKPHPTRPPKKHLR